MKKKFLIITFASLVLISGCKATGTESEADELSSEISSSLSGYQITELETKSDMDEESSSELSAKAAQSSEIANGEDKNISLQSKKEDKSENSGTVQSRQQLIPAFCQSRRLKRKIQILRKM